MNYNKWRIYFKEDVNKFLNDSNNKQIKGRLNEKLKEILEYLNKGERNLYKIFDIKKLKLKSFELELCRLRIGDFRIILDIDY
ncbi:hypothetical protein MJ1_0342 [Nanobdella aerobiophila]|uniref:Uncharacterized protein n=1 Tax=Nanobdella aerobiophila TaxID=2586965 RepID=A0A915WS39_9ARCH|nr:hypothetical protein [Nanobdella aerobiophila]BBL45506.1 hypothetical protein MJ1_0342 [Nanobdella aerobiophila]